MTGDEFVEAAYAGDLSAVVRYLRAGGDVDHVTAKGWTALNAAIQSAVSPEAAEGCKAAARAIIDAGADLTVPSPDGWRPLVKTAAWSSYMADLLSYLLANGDAWRGDEDWKGINFAASWRGAEGIAILCAHGADPDTRDDEGQTPLMRAVKKGHKETVRALIDAGADPDLQDREGLTALMIAARKPVVDNVALLLERGANTELKDEAGRTALDHATEAKRAKVRALLEQPQGRTSS